MADGTVDTDADESPDSYGGTPRWVKAFAVVALLVIVAIGIILISGLGGPHGPQRHGPDASGGVDAVVGWRP